MTKTILLPRRLLGLIVALGGLNVACHDSARDASLDPTCEGDITLATPDELVRIEDCTTFKGDLRIEKNAGLTAISLPKLTTVTGFLSISENPDLVEINLPAFTSEPYGMSVDSNPVLGAIAMPKLTSIDSLHLGMNPVLTSLDISALAVSTGDLLIEDTKLAVVELPHLTAVGNVFSIQNNLILTELHMPELALVKNGASVSNNPSMIAIRLTTLAAVQGQWFDIKGNPALTTLLVPALSELAGDLSITDNTSLSSCVAQALVDRLVNNGWTGQAEIQGNKSTSGCP